MHIWKRVGMAAGTLALMSGGVLVPAMSQSASGATPPTYRVWADTVVPTVPAHQLDNSINVGTRMTVAQSGYVTALRFYKASSNTGTHVGRVYDAAGREVRAVTFSGESASGWQRATLAQPLWLGAGARFTVSTWMPKGHWSYALGALHAPRTSGPLTAVGGSYLFSGYQQFPSMTTEDALYVDADFVPSSTAPAPAPTTSPTKAPVSPSPTPTTSSPAPSSSPTATATKTATPTSSPTASAPAGSCVKPSAANTGVPSGTSLVDDGRSEISDSNVTLSGRRFTAPVVYVTGSGVKIVNSQFTGSVVVRQASNVVLSHSGALSAAVSGSQGVTLEYLNLGGASDAIHITSDTGQVSGVTLRNNYIHNPQPPADAHYDGTQVRGIKGLSITCSTYELGPWQTTYNAGIYLENAQGGDDDIVIDHNWIDGGGFAISVDATNLRVTSNRFGRAYHWGVCDNASNAGGYRSFTSSGNVWDDTGAALNLCGQG